MRKYAINLTWLDLLTGYVKNGLLTGYFHYSLRDSHASHASHAQCLALASVAGWFSHLSLILSDDTNTFDKSDSIIPDFKPAMGSEPN